MSDTFIYDFINAILSGSQVALVAAVVIFGVLLYAALMLTRK